MADVARVVAAAQRLAAQRDDAALEVLIGKREKALKKNRKLKDDPDFDPPYDEQIMGPLDDVKDVARKIIKRWNKELHGLVCEKKKNKAKDKDREAIVNALGVGEAAVIGAVAAALIGLGVTAAIAAALAPLLVRRFIWPAKDTLCESWSEALERKR